VIYYKIGPATPGVAKWSAEEMELRSIPIQNPSVVTRKIGENEIILVNADTAASLALTNHTASVVWDMVDGIKSVQDIIEAVHGRFQDVPNTVRDDVLALLELLTQDGFIGFELRGKE
jgi:hypothetical protein